MAVFVGGIVNGQVIEVDESREVVVIPHPIEPPTDFTQQLPDSVHIKLDRYRRQRRVELDGSISVAYRYEAR